MPVLTHRRKAFVPTSAEQQAEVQQELQAILSHVQFSQSKRYPALLRYLVEHTLRGDTAHIKERTLGIEVFGREPTYDTTNDTIVRFTASEVRRRLAAFYTQHNEHPVHISLPVGSYIPEFSREEQEIVAAQPTPDHEQPATVQKREVEESAAVGEIPEEAPSQPAQGHLVSRPPEPVLTALPSPTPAPMPLAPEPVRYRLVAAWAGAAVLLCLVALWFATRARTPKLTAVDQFWHPLTTGELTPMAVAGGNVFSSNPYSGTETAGREVDYPFVSMQIASAMVHVSNIVHREGRAIDVQAANVTTLSELRDRPLILIGGYNNPWTSELSSGLPIHLAPRAEPAFQEQEGGKRRWQRDDTQPYSASDDYALIGRFHSSKTDSMVVLVAGLGRNGTEAASQFLTDNHRLEALERFAGRPLGSENFEAVLRVPVIQGRTGAPTILAVRSW